MALKLTKDGFINLKDVKFYLNKRNGQLSMTLPKKQITEKRSEKITIPKKIQVRIKW